MTIVVGFGPDVRTFSGVDFGAQLARSSGDELVLCCVVHDAWASPAARDFGGVDDDWRNELRASAVQTLENAVERVGVDVRAETVIRTGRSVPQGLAAEGEARDARMLVVGSSTDGVFGRISFGSVSDRLVHSSRVPVGVAPRGYSEQRVPIGRLVVAVYPTRSDVALTVQVTELAGWLSAPVQVVTFAPRDRTPLGQFASRDVFDYWSEQVRDAHAEIVRDLDAAGTPVEGSGIVEGSGWSDAIASFDWRPGDLLIVGSSEHGPVAQVFLGSTATRIIRYSPVPVVLLPRR
ncbi:universal stress protein [Gordonia sinesedis]